METEFWIKKIEGGEKYSIDFTLSREEAEYMIAEYLIKDKEGHYIIEENKNE